jgi:hypothetical protein
MTISHSKSKPTATVKAPYSICDKSRPRFLKISCSIPLISSQRQPLQVRPNSLASISQVSLAITASSFYTLGMRQISSIIGGQTAVNVYLACRETLHQVTSLLAQFDTFTEKSTFIQNSLLPLYIDKKSKNRKTVTLFFLSFFDRVTKKLQPDFEHQNFILKSYYCWWRSFCFILPGKLIPIFAFLTSGFYIYKLLIKL